MASPTWRRAVDRLSFGRSRSASEHILISELRAARADERIQRAAEYPSREAFERIERGLKRAGVSLDTSEWFYYRSSEPPSAGITRSEGWVLWRPDLGEQLAFLPLG